MGMVLFPSDIVATINRPLDGKTNVLSIAERNEIPITQRYRGMVVVVQNQGAALPQIFWLPTDNLTNSGWGEIDIDVEAMHDAILKEVELRLAEHSCGGDGIIVKLL